MSLTLLRQMSDDSLSLLSSDLLDFAGLVGGAVEHRKLRKLLGQKRARRLIAHVEHFGPEVPPSRALYHLGGSLEADEADEADDMDDVVPEPSRNVLVVGDTHTSPGQDLSRFTWLGRAARDLLGHGDMLLLMGDHYNTDGLCFHSTRAAREGLRFDAEKEAGDMARDLIDAELGKRNIRKVICEGNHDERPKRFMAENPYWAGAIDIWGGWEDAGWEVKPFLEPFRFSGWRAQHYFPNHGGRAVSSSTGTARVILEKQVRFSESCLFGHDHLHSVWTGATPAGGRKWSLGVGWYGGYEEYAGPDSNANWWTGFWLLSNVKDGDADLQGFRMDTIRKRWG